ncbi:MAG: hypothetical protein KAH57_00010 [Thermoplasmata archaeon]|nr:hypothetical protein [Thermoplasmata archaeon]
MDDALSVMNMRRGVVLGICTADFSYLHDMVALLGDAVDRFHILEGGRRTDKELDCLMLEEGTKAPIMRAPLPPMIDILNDPWVTLERAMAAAMGRLSPDHLIIGVDPGKRPGIAFLADGKTISTFQASGLSEVYPIVSKGQRAYHAHHDLLRMGDGDPASRDAILGELSPLGIATELVDERFTTRGTKYRDENAAIHIGRTLGRPL